jgi:hypothetical protein
MHKLSGPKQMNSVTVALVSLFHIQEAPVQFSPLRPVVLTEGFSLGPYKYRQVHSDWRDLSPLGTLATSGPITPAPDDRYGYVALVRWELAGKPTVRGKTSRTSATLSTINPHRTWNQTRADKVGSQLMTAWAVARPFASHLIVQCHVARARKITVCTKIGCGKALECTAQVNKILEIEEKMGKRTTPKWFRNGQLGIILLISPW